MDSLTQLALGAAVGQAVLGPRVGRRALLWGAALGTLPDLDVLVPMGDAIADYSYHRSWSHSLLVLVASSPLFAWLAARVHRDRQASYGRWLVLVLSVFVTHVLLDCFTVYGTQIFWPWPRPPEAWATVFIIDFAYTLPLLLGCIGAWYWARRDPRRAQWINLIGLALSTLYLGWTVVAKLEVERVVSAQLARDGVHDARVLTVPSPLNTLLWRVLLRREGSYAEGYYSLASGETGIELREHACDDRLLAGLRDQPSVARLLWFTDGFCAAARDGDEVVITDLRMGSEPYYVFRFAVAREGPTGSVGRESPTVVEPIEPRGITTTPDPAMLPRIWARIWDPSVRLD